MDRGQRGALIDLVRALVDQERARIVVAPMASGDGFWFGGGNIVEDRGAIWVTGRYRNRGDSRTGLAAGTRGVECALFRSTDAWETFERVAGWSKADLSRRAEVLSIEGSALHRLPDGSWELFVSTEKNLPYPEPFRSYQKPGTGVWSIDRLTGSSLDALEASTLRPVLASVDPAHLHVKDPAVYEGPDGTDLLFCSHPMSWASSNTGLAVRPRAEDRFTVRSWNLVPRGDIWDVAVTRVTNCLPVPCLGRFASASPIVVMFYDGAESLRRLDEHASANRRPRGYSCEELGGAAWAPADDLSAAQRLSLTEPLFVSPYGTGSSRYVSTLTTQQGVYATWQQAQPDGSQPLVMNFLPADEVAAILAG
jgi:hypothetical protein